MPPEVPRQLVKAKAIRFDPAQPSAIRKWQRRGCQDIKVGPASRQYWLSIDNSEQSAFN